MQSSELTRDPAARRHTVWGVQLCHLYHLSEGQVGWGQSFPGLFLMNILHSGSIYCISPFSYSFSTTACLDYIACLQPGSICLHQSSYETDRQWSASYKLWYWVIGSSSLVYLFWLKVTLGDVKPRTIPACYQWSLNLEVASPTSTSYHSPNPWSPLPCIMVPVQEFC